VQVAATLHRFQIAQLLQWLLDCGMDNRWQLSDSSFVTVTRLLDGQRRDLNSSPGKAKRFLSSPINPLPFLQPLRVPIRGYLDPFPRGQSTVVSRWPLRSTAADNNECKQCGDGMSLQHATIRYYWLQELNMESLMACVLILVEIGCDWKIGTE